MSLTNLKRKLVATVRRPARQQQPDAPAELGAWPYEQEDDRRPLEAEDDFEGEGWTFWGV